MVTAPAIYRAAVILPTAIIAAVDEKAQPLLQRLDPQKRAMVLLALAGLVILGLGWMVMVYLGARYVKRIARQRPPQRQREPSDWQRLRPVDEHKTTDDDE